ncbi:hypothetical protein CS063_03215 [Sporanaerobium hydrogeniformans]|uniref:Uncharacterized protein n=1 Tax=Sporanaerobium hydrogeniformans TaxID=3072179 RepID=A0AC61DG56_9FIRM|nr:DUF5721 family protein [Sporanaerobium hydrogeniformans]PHV71587.1 hypothetical protein CS063_03215 [Sporanaerobium hydrogeniformans]
MEVFEITSRKEFMSQLLKSDLFDTFEVREVVIHSAFKILLDGKRNSDFYDTEEEVASSDYVTWREMKKKVYELMQGARMPSYFKIILSTNKEKTSALSSEVSTFFLNIQLKDNQTTCSTGCAYKGFTLDKSVDKIWDERIKKFLFKYQFI